MKRQLISLAVAAAFTLGAPLAMAQTDSAAVAAPATSTVVPIDNAMHHDKMMQHENPMQHDNAMQHKHMMKHDRMGMHHRTMGRHTMPSTVDSIDHKTGIVEVTAAGMHLKVHFPPPTITDLKAGDKINLMLGYRMQNAPVAEKPAASE